MKSKEYPLLVQKHLSTTRVLQNLQSSKAVVLERIARGAGTTNWFYCRDHIDLGLIEKELWPGSLVSFYFDNRIQHTQYSAVLHSAIQEIVDNERECVIGFLEKNEISIEVDFVSAIWEVSDFVSSHGDPNHFFFGAFPGRDNDGDCAVTVTLPDEDGVVRKHPY